MNFKKRILSFLLILCMAFQAGTFQAIVVAAEVNGETEWILSSPNGKVSITITLDGGVLTYSTEKEGRALLLDAAMGLNVTGLADFRNGLTFGSASDITSISESYPMYSGKASTYYNNANEQTLAFSKDSKIMKIALRAYDDGVAFRYVLEGSGNYTVANEGTAVKLSSGSTFYAQLYQTSRPCYENNYNTYQLSTASGDFGMPLLVKTSGNDWLLYAQADLSGTYAGTKLRLPSGGGGLFSFEFTAGSPTIELPFKSPWRTCVIGSPKQLAESQIFENLCEPNKIEDTSWLNPGVSSWSWLSTSTSQQNDGDLQTRFLNLAADMGWASTIIDHGWLASQANVTYLPWFEDYMKLAKDKNIGVWVWEDVGYLDDQAKRDRRFPEWSEKGAIGVKVDYFYTESQAMLKNYDDIIKDAADNKLMLNFHGSNLPSGQRRTWPNAMAFEGVNGVEHAGATNAFNNCLLPFSRNVLGPMDFTPALVTKVNNNYTPTHAAALGVVFECGASTFGDTPANYAASGARNFLHGMPTVWNESIMLDGDPGSYVVMARRYNENWYVGAITNEARTYNLPLSFLGEGMYYASIYRDQTSTTTSAEEYTPVTKDSVLSLPMLLHGGAGVKIVRELPKMPESISVSKTEITLTEKQSETITVSCEPSDAVLMNLKWESSNPSVATVASGTITAVKAGSATITVTTSNGLSATVKVTVNPKLELGDTWSVVNPTDNAFLSAANELTVTLEKGDIWKGNGQGKNVYLTDVPEGDWEVVVKLTGDLSSHVQSAGLIAWVDADHYVSNLRRFHNSYGGKCFAMISETSSSNAVETPCHSEKDLFEQYGENFPDAGDVYLKIIKTGNVFTGFVSITGENWIKITEHTNAIGESDRLKIGLFSTGDVSTIVKYSDFTINGKILKFTANADGSEGYIANPTWTITREDSSNFVSVAPTRLELITNIGDLWNASNTAKNIYHVENGVNDFDVSVKLTFAPTLNYQTASLVAYAGDNQYVSIARCFDSRRETEPVGSSNVFKVVTESTSSNANQDGYVSGKNISNTVYLRLKKTGNDFTGYFSETGAEGTWQTVRTVTNSAVGSSGNLKLGFYTSCGGTATTTTTAVFENFTLNGELIPFLIPKPIYRISLDQAGIYTFQSAAEGYGGQAAKSVTVSNIGNQPTADLTVELSGSDSDAFALSKTTIASIPANESDSFTIVPIQGLTEGHYQATVTVSGPEGIEASFNVEFTVSEPPEYVRNPIWTITREDSPNFVSVTPTRLELVTNQGDLWNASNSAKNIYTIDNGSGDFDVNVKLTFAPTLNYQTASLVAYAGDNQYVSIARCFDSRRESESVGSSNVFKVVTESTSGNANQDGYVSGKNISNTVYLRLKKVGNDFTGYFSETGAEGTWQTVRTVTNSAAGSSSSLRLGFYTCYGGTATATTTAVFENFALNGELIPFLAPVEYIKFSYGDKSATEIIPGETLNITAGLENLDISQTMIAAIYHANGTLVKFVNVNGIPTESGGRIKFDLNLDIPEDTESGSYVKVFIWDSETYTPVHEFINFPDLS